MAMKFWDWKFRYKNLLLRKRMINEDKALNNVIYCSWIPNKRDFCLEKSQNAESKKNKKIELGYCVRRKLNRKWNFVEMIKNEISGI